MCIRDRCSIFVVLIEWLLVRIFDEFAGFSLQFEQNLQQGSTFGRYRNIQNFG